MKTKRFKNYLLKFTPKGSGPFGGNWIRAFDSDVEVGSLFFGQFTKGSQFLRGSVKVNLNHRRRGLATAMYLWGEKLLGKTFTPDVGNSSLASKFWNAGNNPFAKRNITFEQQVEMKFATARGIVCQELAKSNVAVEAVVDHIFREDDTSDLNWLQFKQKLMRSFGSRDRVQFSEFKGSAGPAEFSVQFLAPATKASLSALRNVLGVDSGKLPGRRGYFWQSERIRGDARILALQALHRVGFLWSDEAFSRLDFEETMDLFAVDLRHPNNPLGGRF